MPRVIIVRGDHIGAGGVVEAAACERRRRDDSRNNPAGRQGS